LEKRPLKQSARYLHQTISQIKNKLSYYIPKHFSNDFFHLINNF
jgi:hypothetical protein